MQFLDPIITVEVMAINYPVYKEPLILECSTTILSTISNTFDIIWSTDNVQVGRVNNITAISDFNSSFMYNNSFVISSLNVSDIGNVYQCEVVINSILHTTTKADFIIPIPGMYSVALQIYTNSACVLI